VFNFILSGANGFIGSQLVDKLNREGFNVVSLNLFLQSSVNDAFEAVSADPGSTWILINCSSPNEIRIKNETALGIDSLSPVYALLEFMKVARLSRLIHFSTIQVFGTELSGELYFDSPVNIETQYAKIHYEIEKYISEEFSKIGIISVILRLSNVYGAHAKNFEKRISLVPNCFVHELLNNSSITLLSSGKQIRNFLSISELVNRIIDISRQGFKVSYTDICASDLYMSILNSAEICLAQYSKVLGKIGTLEITSEIPLETTLFKLIPKYPNLVVNSLTPIEEFEVTVRDLFKNESKKGNSYE
jgi:UDP-glucose 4-epimerase